MPSTRYAQINLPHAQTVLGRIVQSFTALAAPGPVPPALMEIVDRIDALLRHYVHDPPEDEAIPVADTAAAEARTMVEVIASCGLRGDRLGQCVRNFFECLGLAEEGADLSLACGERPDSPLRP